MLNRSITPITLFTPLLWALVATMPTSAESGNAKRGEAVYQKSNCYICHPGGANTIDPGHPIKGAAFAQKYKDDRVLEETIRKGFKESGMPANDKTKITEAEMKDLIAYIRTLTDAKAPGNGVNQDK